MALRRIARSGWRGASCGLTSFHNGALSEKYVLSHYMCANVNRMSVRSRGISVTPTRPSPSARLAVEESDSGCENSVTRGLEATRPGEKPRVVVLGTGWAACRFLKGLDTKMYDVVCVSPRNHMVFTPLLASTCVGTLEFRSVAEPVSRIQSALARDPGSYFFLASCTGIDTIKHEVYCQTADGSELPNNPYQFKVAYDKLVIAAGAEPLTFGIKGVKEHAFFLREVSHAQEIRKKLLLNLMLSENPGLSEAEKKRLLHCVVIGGGPTGVEFSGELSDFIMKDVQERYTHVKDYIRVTLIEANEILSSFDVGLRQYAANHLTKAGVRLMRGVVKEVHPEKIVLSDGTDVGYGLLVWSTGVGPSEFVKSLDLPKSHGGRVGIDEWMRVPGVEDVFALGDCAGFVEKTGRPVLPALAQVGAGREVSGGTFRQDREAEWRQGAQCEQRGARGAVCLQASRKHGFRRGLQGVGRPAPVEGWEGAVAGRIPQLADMAISLPDPSRQLAKQALCGCKLGNHSLLRPRQRQDRLKPDASFSPTYSFEF